MRGKILIAGLCALSASVAQAEDVDLVGTFPAESRPVAMLQSIAVQPFAGRNGPQISMALERALMQAQVEGRPYFVVRPDGRDADGVVSGAVKTNVSDYGYTEKRDRCAEKDDRGKCVRKEKQEVRCRRRTVEVSADVRVADRRAGAVAYTRTVSHNDVEGYCEDEGPPDSVGEVIDKLSADVVDDLRDDFAPTTRNYSVRFRETTKGLDKDAAARFKGHVKQSQRDLPAACAGWEAIDGATPDHVATVFDLGVCAEAKGDLRGALTRYERASTLLGKGNEAEDSAKRVRQLLAAREDLEARGRR